MTGFHDLINGVLVIVLVLNLFALGSSRILTVIRIAAAQGALLSVLPLLNSSAGWPSLAASAGAIVLKGFVIPFMMGRSLRAAKIKREVEPFIGFFPSVLLGAGATGAALLLSTQIPLEASQTGTLIVPASIATIVVGFLILTTRYKALTQVIGYLILENGIYLFGLLLVEALPLVIELGVLLDLFVGIFVITIITNRINDTFASMDTRRLASLKE